MSLTSAKGQKLYRIVKTERTHSVLVMQVFYLTLAYYVCTRRSLWPLVCKEKLQ